MKTDTSPVYACLMPSPAAIDAKASVGPADTATSKGPPAICTPPKVTCSFHIPERVTVGTTSYEPSSRSRTTPNWSGSPGRVIVATQRSPPFVCLLPKQSTA